MRQRRPLAVLVACLLVFGLAGPVASAGPAGAADPADGYGVVRNFLPPGQSGTVTAADFALVSMGYPVNRVAVDGKNAPRNFANQLEMYDAIGKLSPDQLRTADLAAFYKP